MLEEKGREKKEELREREEGKGGIVMEAKKVGERGVLLSREGSLGSPITFSKMDCKSLERAGGFAGANTFTGAGVAGEGPTGRYEEGRPFSK